MTAEGQVVLPSQFGRYTLIQRLATGGMAEVFRAKIVSSHGFEKIIVIKRILPHLAADRTFVAMFIDEAKLTAQLTHPKIVQVLDFGEVAGQYFIALEFIDGHDALALLRLAAQRRVRVPLSLVVSIVAEILDALDYAHTALDMEGRPMRLVHRDISPSNIFISRHGDVKLGDFGIAHASDRESKTQAGTLKGKYGYMSPEQVTGGNVDGRSDLFAVGIVLAEAFMGRRLFTARADLDVLLMVRDGRLDRLNRYGHDVPHELDQIVRKALRRDLDERFQTATEFRDALFDYLFAQKLRVGPADLRAFMSDLSDPSPAATARVHKAGRPLSEPLSSHAAPLTHAEGGANKVVAGVTGDDGGETVGIAASEPAAAAREPASDDQGPGRGRGRGRARSPAADLGTHARAPSSPAGVLAVVRDAIAPGGDAVRAAGSRAGSSNQGLSRGAAPTQPTVQAAAPVSLAAAKAAAAAGIVVGAPASVAASGSPLAEALSATEFSLIDLDQWDISEQHSSAHGTGWTPVAVAPARVPPPQAARRNGGMAGGGGGAGTSDSGRHELGRFISAAPHRPPDSAGDLGTISAMRIFADVTVAGETGLLRFERMIGDSGTAAGANEAEIKEVFLAAGAPESVNSSVTSERFGAYLVSRGVLRAAELEMALGMLPHFSGKLGDTLVGLGLMRPLDVFRQLSQQVRDRVIDLFCWSRGTFAFFRGVHNEQESFPLGLDGFEILGAGALTVSPEDVERRFSPLLDGRPRRTERRRIDPDAFHLGPTPREVLALFDGQRTLHAWLSEFTSPEERTIFLRSLYLLIETDLAELDVLPDRNFHV